MGNCASTRYGSAPAKVLVLSHDLYETRKDGSPTPKPRDGNHVDVKRLNELFQSRGIKSLFHENFTKHEILTTLNYFCEVEVNPHCMAVVVMTHGGNRGTLEAKDEAYRTWDVYEALQKCKTKLRIIFFIACRGNTLEKLVYTNDKPKASTSSRRNNGHSSQPDSGPFDTEEKIQNVGTLIVQDPNFLVVYCTEENRLSFRHPTTGAWYLESLCNELNEMTVPEDIMSLLTRVNNKVADRRKEDNDGNYLVQTPCIVSTLTSEFIVSCPGDHNFGSLESNDSQPSPQQEEFEVTASEVHCLVYHSTPYKEQADQITRTIRKIGFQPKKFTEFSELIKIAEKNIGKNKKCLFVIIVAQLKREWYDPAWYIMTDDVSRKSETHVWHSYRNHSKFNGKPKIFFFLDPFAGQGARSETGMQSDGSFNHVPEHFNFLRVYGFGIDFLQHLCVALEIWPHYQRSERIRRDLCRVVRRAMRYYKPIPGQYSYTETTLGVNVMLNGQSWCSATATSTSTTSSSQLSGPVPAPKATRKRNKKAIVTQQLSNLLSSCFYIVGKDKTRMECDAVNHDNCHSILDPTSSPSETKRMKIEIELPHIEPQAFRVIQNYKRDNSLQMDLTYNEAFDVYAAYQTYKSIPQDLVNHCWKIVINNCNTEAQMCSGYNFAMASQSFKMLDFFLTKILNNISAFLKCDNFVTISTDTLITILQQICLNCTEIELFEACVHWCEKQPDYKRENLRKFMEPFLGHIRFLSMSPSEFMANKQIIDVLSDQELGAIVKKINGKECDDWPSTISTITSSRIRD